MNALIAVCELCTLDTHKARSRVQWRGRISSHVAAIFVRVRREFEAGKEFRNIVHSRSTLAALLVVSGVKAYSS